MKKQNAPLTDFEGVYIVFADEQNIDIMRRIAEFMKTRREIRFPPGARDPGGAAGRAPSDCAAAVQRARECVQPRERPARGEEVSRSGGGGGKGRFGPAGRRRAAW